MGLPHPLVRMCSDRAKGAPLPEDAALHARLKELFFHAIELDAEERERFLDTACEGDADLRASIARLLEHHKRSDLPDDYAGED